MDAAILITGWLVAAILLVAILWAVATTLYRRILRWRRWMRDRLEIPLPGQVWDFPGLKTKVTDVYADGDIRCDWMEGGQPMSHRFGREVWDRMVRRDHAFIVERK